MLTITSAIAVLVGLLPAAAPDGRCPGYDHVAATLRLVHGEHKVETRVVPTVLVGAMVLELWAGDYTWSIVSRPIGDDTACVVTAGQLQKISS